jgi:hypothetical protein
VRRAGGQVAACCDVNTQLEACVVSPTRSGRAHPAGTVVWVGAQELHIMGSLLQLRGHTRSTTPLRDDQGSLLVFNGASPPNTRARVRVWERQGRSKIAS